jgi:hypothetical protein
VWEGAGPLRPVILTKYYIYTRSIKFALGISRCKIRGWGGAGIKHYLVFPVRLLIEESENNRFISLARNVVSAESLESKENILLYLYIYP